MNSNLFRNAIRLAIASVFFLSICITYMLGGLHGRAAGESYQALIHQNLETRLVVRALEALENEDSNEARRNLNYLLDDILASRADHVQKKPLPFSSSPYRAIPDRDYLGKADHHLYRFALKHPHYAGPDYPKLIDAIDAMPDSASVRAAYLGQWQSILDKHMSLIGTVYSCDSFPYGDIDENICATYATGHKHYLTVAFYDAPGGKIIAHAPATTTGIDIQYLGEAQWLNGYLWGKYKNGNTQGYLPYDRWRMYQTSSLLGKLQKKLLLLAKIIS